MSKTRYLFSFENRLVDIIEGSHRILQFDMKRDEYHKNLELSIQTQPNLKRITGCFPCVRLPCIKICARIELTILFLYTLGATQNRNHLFSVV